MKYMFASDVHGSAFYCRKMLEAFETEKADRLVLLGDLLYHGPRNDLPKEYAPKQVISMLRFIQLYLIRHILVIATAIICHQRKKMMAEGRQRSLPVVR